MNPLKTETYGYAAREFLSSADGAWDELDFTYDAVGNRLTRVATVLGVASTETYSYAANDNRLASVSGASSRTFTHDAAGNVTYDNRTGGGYGYAYDAAGRMESFSINGVVQAEYEYDAQGRQTIIRRVQAGETVHVVFDIHGQRLAEYDYDEVTGVTTLLREYVWLDGVPIAVVEGSNVYFVRTDHIGRPVFATDVTGTKVWEATYLPFGGVHTSTGSNTDLRFPGQWFQSESGLHQNWMRDYDPMLGRYIQADPLGLVDGASVYNYALQNPGRNVDPRGENALVGASPWGRAGAAGRFLGNALNSLAPGATQAMASTVASVLPMGATDHNGALGPLEDALDRVRVAEANGQCPDPCDSARRR